MTNLLQVYTDYMSDINSPDSPQEEPKKDWEPEIYQRVEEPKKELGRYLSEVNSEVKGIAKDVQDLQKT